MAGNPRIFASQKIPTNHALHGDLRTLLGCKAAVPFGKVTTAVGAALSQRRVGAASLGCLLLATCEGKMGCSWHWGKLEAAWLWKRYGPHTSAPSPPPRTRKRPYSPASPKSQVSQKFQTAKIAKTAML